MRLDKRQHQYIQLHNSATGISLKGARDTLAFLLELIERAQDSANQTQSVRLHDLWIAVNDAHKAVKAAKIMEAK